MDDSSEIGCFDPADDELPEPVRTELLEALRYGVRWSQFSRETREDLRAALRMQRLRRLAEGGAT